MISVDALPGGLKNDTFIEALKMLNKEFNIVGLGLLEYKLSREKAIKLLEDIMQIGTNL